MYRLPGLRLLVKKNLVLQVNHLWKNLVLLVTRNHVKLAWIKKRYHNCWAGAALHTGAGAKFVFTAWHRTPLLPEVKVLAPTIDAAQVTSREDFAPLRGICI